MQCPKLWCLCRLGNQTPVTKSRTGSARLLDSGLISAIDNRPSRLISTIPPANTPSAIRQNRHVPIRPPIPELRSPPGAYIMILNVGMLEATATSHPTPSITLKNRLAGMQPRKMAHWMATPAIIKVNAMRTNMDGRSTPRNKYVKVIKADKHCTARR